MHPSVVSNATIRRRARRDVDRILQQLREYYSAPMAFYAANEEEEEDIRSRERVEIWNEESGEEIENDESVGEEDIDMDTKKIAHPQDDSLDLSEEDSYEDSDESSSRAQPVWVVSQSLPRSDTPEVFRPSIRVGRSGLEAIPCTAAQLHLLTLLEHMNHQVTQLTATVNSLCNRMNNKECSSEMPEEIPFPCGSLEEVDSLEQWLKEPRNASMKKNMISSLASIGGEDTKRVTWNILAHIFSDNVAKKITWKGANGKKAFNQMATKALLARAVRKSHVATHATDLDINKHIIRWFNLASDRGGGRRERSRVQAAAAAAEEDSD